MTCSPLNAHIQPKFVKCFANLLCAEAKVAAKTSVAKAEKPKQKDAHPAVVDIFAKAELKVRPPCVCQLLQ